MTQTPQENIADNNADVLFVSKGIITRLRNIALDVPNKRMEALLALHYLTSLALLQPEDLEWLRDACQNAGGSSNWLAVHITTATEILHMASYDVRPLLERYLQTTFAEYGADRYIVEWMKSKQSFFGIEMDMSIRLLPRQPMTLG